MATKSFRFVQFADLRLEGVGIMHASFTLLLNVTENNIENGKHLYLFASLLCNAAKAYGSGKLLPWCQVSNNIDYNKYILSQSKRSFALNHNEIMIGDVDFIISDRRNKNAILEVQAGYALDTGYTGIIRPFPGKVTRKILLNSFNRGDYEKLS